MKRQFGFHWLSKLGVVKADEAHLLELAAKTATQCECDMFELACAPLNCLSARDTAVALLNGGVIEAALCRFFPDDLSCGDPIDKPDAAKATMLKDIEFMLELRQHGLKVRHITGPSTYVLGKRYSLAEGTLLAKMVQFVQGFLPDLKQAGLQLNVEYLRPGEDHVLCGMGNACKLIDGVGSANVRIHFDAFHATERGESLSTVLDLANGRLGYTHLHGSKRLPPTVVNMDGSGFSDEIVWTYVASALERNNYSGPVVPEPFGQVVREQIPVLGEGLPPGIDAERFYKMARTAFGRLRIV